MSAALPTTPHDVPDAPYREIVEAYLRHVEFLVHAHHGIGEPVPAGDLAAHAIAALASQHAVAERVLHTRWTTARDALTYGATVDDVAAAMGLDPDEVTFGLSRWADGELRERRLTPAQHDAVLALIDGAEVTR